MDGQNGSRFEHIAPILCALGPELLQVSLCFGSNLGINKFSIAKNTDMRFGWLGAEYENELPWNHVLVQRLSGNFECYLNVEA